jgi:hypothetical protein
MDGVTLPVIGMGRDNTILESNSNGSIDVIEEEDVGVDKFEQGLELMALMSFPDLDPKSSMKSRISNLETTEDVQSEYNKATQHSFINVSANLKSCDDNIKSLLISMQNDFDQRLALLKKEYDHRYDPVPSFRFEQLNPACANATANHIIALPYPIY